MAVLANLRPESGDICQQIGRFDCQTADNTAPLPICLCKWRGLEPYFLGNFAGFFMALTSQDITRIARLARLDLDVAHSARMLDQLNGFFNIVGQMNAVDTTGIEPLAHPTAVMGTVALRLRDDVVSEPNQREANQRSAPAVEQGLFLVPKVIE
jgi:aspartyl-tRNA(Asn)/glutamyl-tRNA(Gln) amidotransferase subunit C